MEKVVFPQANKAPAIIKEKVMGYLMTDINKRSSLIKRFSLTKILLPNLVILVLIVSVFSFISQRKGNGPIQTKISDMPIITSTSDYTEKTTDITTTTDIIIDSIELEDIQLTFNDKLTEADILLQELANLDNLI